MPVRIRLYERPKQEIANCLEQGLKSKEAVLKKDSLF